LILTHVEEGSTIISDKFATYVNQHSSESNLSQYGYTHVYVNHQNEYTDPIQTWIHTDTIEREWRSLRTYICPIRRSIKPEILQGYIDTFLLKSTIRDQVFADIFLQMMAQLTQNDHFVH